MLVSLLSLSACESNAPTLMKASKQFKTDKKREQHIAYMRKNHMDALKHKRDETMYQGIRTEEHSLNACINCHVPETYNGKVLRHTDQQHFCTTCHTYVAAQLNCFECHVDHPIKSEASTKAIESQKKQFKNANKSELMDLAFKYANSEKQIKNPRKGGGMSFDMSDHTNLKHNRSETSSIKKSMSDE